MNGAKGRARTMAKINRQLVHEAKVDGIDPTNRKAFAAWKEAKDVHFYARLMRESIERRTTEKKS